MTWRERGHILFVTIDVHHRVGRNRVGNSVGKNVSAGGRIGSRQLRRRDLEPIVNGRVRRGEQARQDGEGS